MSLSWTIVIFILSILLSFNAADLGFKIFTLQRLFSQSDDTETNSQFVFDFTREGIKNAFDYSLRPTFHALMFEQPDEAVYSIDSDADWESLLPLGDGFTYATDQHKRDKIVSAVAMYHQLHCLETLRATYIYFREGGLASEFMIAEPHVAHCLNYLRQSAICAADMTLESTHYHLDFYGNLTVGADGNGFKHKCRDPELVRRYLEKNYVVYNKTKQHNS